MLGLIKQKKTWSAKDGLEVDFALAREEEITQVIEVKVSDGSLGKPLLYFYEKYNYPSVQIVKTLRHEHERDSIHILKAEKFLSELFL